MERLNKFYDKLYRNQEEAWNYMREYGSKDINMEAYDEMKEILKFFRILKRYTGIGTPEELSQLKQEVDSGLRPLLPCKVGDTVYKIITLMNGETLIVEGVMLQYAITRTGEEFYFSEPTRQYDIWCNASDFGKTVFLSYEAAEAALKEGENE
ncbi:hypothetical protein [Anaerovorax sp. IOR16]|uniref:hypothetical protein n=1 Tax=Anaerovorax sp. IOR16 TaxID=2773458 RepID=UPI0019D21EF6|nr:hypothetical protein [Anaerovorax sp. IOR16]